MSPLVLKVNPLALAQAIKFPLLCAPLPQRQHEVTPVRKLTLRFPEVSPQAASGQTNTNSSVVQRVVAIWNCCSISALSAGDIMAILRT